jgi:hypothetical protein
MMEKVRNQFFLEFDKNFGQSKLEDINLDL